MITTFGSPTAAPTDGTTTPRPSRATSARAAGILRKRQTPAGQGAGEPRQPLAGRGRAQSRDGPGAVSPFGGGGCGPGGTGGVRVGARQTVSAPGQPASARSRPASSSSGGFEPSRPDRIGRPSGVPSRIGQGTSTAGSSQAKPSSSEPSYSFVTR